MRKIMKIYNKGAAGYSLIELMIAISLCVLLVHFSLINTRYFNKAIINGELDLLYNTCCYLQQVAITRNETQELYCNAHEHSFHYNGHTHSLSKGIQFGVLSFAKGPPSSPGHALTSAVTFDQKKIVFYPDGIISAGSLYLIDQSTQTLYAMSSGIGPISFLRKYYYDGAWQLM